MARPPVPIVVAALFATVAVCALAGCAPDGGESPSPEPTVEAATPSPSPQWTAEQQGAIDAVQRYLEVWTDISQNLETADWNQVRDVAGDPAANNVLSQWATWFENGWHLVGGPVFTPDYAIPGALDYLGQRYHVHGCYIPSDAYLSDATGVRVSEQSLARTTVNYLVLHLEDTDRSIVIEDVSEGNPC